MSRLTVTVDTSEFTIEKLYFCYANYAKLAEQEGLGVCNQVADFLLQELAKRDPIAFIQWERSESQDDYDLYKLLRHHFEPMKK